MASSRAVGNASRETLSFDTGRPGHPHDPAGSRPRLPPQIEANLMPKGAEAEGAGAATGTAAAATFARKTAALPTTAAARGVHGRRDGATDPAAGHAPGPARPVRRGGDSVERFL